MARIALRSLGMTVGVAAVLGVAACAPQQSATPAAAAPASQMSLGASPSAAAPAQRATAPGMQGHDMSSMDMQGMMAHCAQLRGQVRQGGAVSADTRRMLAQCDEMDRAHGMTPARR